MLKPIIGCFISLILTPPSSAREPIIGGPCEGCENVFIGQPKELTSTAHITEKNDKGQPMVLKGQVLNSMGDPASNIIVYAYQTDENGKYPNGITRHGNMRAWARTDDQGNYKFNTIRPGSYPGRNLPQHIHMHIIEPNVATYYIGDVTFTDDPLITKKQLKQQNCRGGCGLVTPVRDENGVLQVHRNIALGKNIPNYSKTK